MAEILQSPMTQPCPPGRCLYLQAEDLGQAPELLARAAEAGFAVAIADAYVDGATFFPSAVREDFGLPPLSPRFDPACWEKLITTVLDEGLALVARVELLRAGATRAPFAPSPFRKRFRQWLVRDARGSLITADDERASAWLSAWSSDVLDYLGALAAELCDAYPIDGIWLDDWWLPQAVVSRCVISPPENILIPPAPPEIEDPQLEEELREDPYDSPGESPELRVAAKLLRVLRARGRRGSHFPLLLLGRPHGDVALLARLVAEGLAEGCVVPLGAEVASACNAHDKVGGVMWALVEAKTSPPGDASLPAAFTSVIYPSEAFAQKQPEFLRSGDMENIPEFTATACAHALRQCLQVAQTADPQFQAVLRQAVGADLEKFLSAGSRRTEKLQQLVKVLREHAAQSECPTHFGHDLLRRAIGYAHLLANYYVT